MARSRQIQSDASSFHNPALPSAAETVDRNSCSSPASPKKRRPVRVTQTLTAQSDAAWGGLEVWMLSETAICLTQEGATEEALAVGAEACRVAEVKTGPAGVALRKNSLAGLLKAGRPADALTLLDGVLGNTPYHATELALVRAEASLGSAASARDWLDEAYRLIHHTEQSYLQARADGLSRRL